VAGWLGEIGVQASVFRYPLNVRHPVPLWDWTVSRAPVSRNDRQCADVARLDVREVAPVHGRDGSDGQALTDRDHRRIRTAQPPVRIAPHQFSHTAQVGIEARRAGNGSSVRCLHCRGTWPRTPRRGTCRSCNRPRPAPWTARSAAHRSQQANPGTRRDERRGGRTAPQTRSCRRRSRTQHATGRTPPPAAHRPVSIDRTGRYRRYRRTLAALGLARCRACPAEAASAVRGHARLAPRPSRRQAAGAASSRSPVECRQTTQPDRRAIGRPGIPVGPSRARGARVPRLTDVRRIGLA